MARTFRYRYVEFGTSFAGDPRTRGPQSGSETPGILFANALATDVGGTCWGANEPLPIIDHHFLREAQFPSASAAVLHKASQIRQRFRDQDLIWLVTHKEPDFDAFCSMYLARWIIEDPHAVVDWQRYGLHPDAWLEVPDGRKIDWFNPDLAIVPSEHRWAVLLASYASTLEARRRVSCPPQRALRSVLYAALKRGRDYLSEISGASEFFHEIRSILLHQQLNPVFDSVLEDSSLFAPELAMLDREAAAYQRDVRRARRSIVYLPESEAPSPDFFKNRELAHQEQRRASDLDAEHLLLADTFRIPTDGIYLRDPECVLFKEWARVDLENSFLGAGFEFTAIANSAGRPEAPSNRTDYQFSIDPERANGRHLYTVWSRLQTQEVEAVRAHEQDIVAVGTALRRGGSHGTATLGILLADPWVGGQSQFGNAVGTPHRGTLLGPPGVRSDLRDDPVAEAVRTELEGSIYSAVSLVNGPQVTLFDFAGSKEAVDIAPQRYDLNSPLDIPAPPRSYFRFAAVRLRSDVPIAAPNLATQIAETLWQVLYPEIPGATPPDFSDLHMIVSADCVGVWGDRGVAVAQKQDSSAGASAPDGQASELRAEFAGIVAMARDVDRLTARWARISSAMSENGNSAASVGKTTDTEGMKSIVASAEELTVRSAQIRHALTLPEHVLLQRFYNAINLDQSSEALHELSQSASEHLHRYELGAQAKQMESRAEAMARVQSKLEWLEVFVVGLLAVGIIDVITQSLRFPYQVEDALIVLGGPLFLGFMAWLLKPWRRKKSGQAKRKIDRAAGILIVVAVAFVVAWLAGLVHMWMR